MFATSFATVRSGPRGRGSHHNSSYLFYCDLFLLQTPPIQASHSWTGRSQAPAAWDGIDEHNLWSMHRFGGDLLNKRFKQVLSGPNATHHALIDDEDALWVFGRNEKGQLGLGHTRNVYTPVKVPNLPPVRTAACGRSHTMAVTLDGKVYGAGENLKGQLGTGRVDDTVTKFTAAPVLGVVAVAVQCGAEFSVMLDSTGALYFVSRWHCLWGV